MRAVLDELDAHERPAARRQIGRDEIVSAVARAALLGARGNSGVILSQIVRGAAEELASRPGRAGRPGARLRRASRARPTPPTRPCATRPRARCSSAVRAMAHRVAHDLAHMDTPRLGPDATAEEQDALLAEVLENALEAGKEAVERGPEQLRGAARGRRRRRRRLRPDRDHRRLPRRAARRAPPRARAPATRRRALHRPEHESSELPLLHELRRHRRGPRGRTLRRRCSSSIGDSVLVVGDDAHAARARAHRRPGARGGALRRRAARCRASTSPTCTSRWPSATRGSARRRRRAPSRRDVRRSSRSRAATGRQATVRGARRAGGGRRRDDEPVDLRAARGHPRGAGATRCSCCRTART